MTKYPAREQQGIALIAILLLLVFMLAIVGGLFYRHQIHIQKVSRALTGEQALLLLLSAESWAASVLRKDVRQSGTDHAAEDWARSLPLLPVEGGTVSGCLIDLQGRFNLNNLEWYTNKSWDDELAEDQFNSTMKVTRRLVMKRLLDRLELDSSDVRIASLVDWVDPDSWLVTPESAEDNEYLLLDPPYRPANHSLVELTELSLVQGYSAQDVAALQPYVSALPEPTPVNVNTAPATVLEILIPNGTADLAKTLMDKRPYASTSEFYDEVSAAVGIPSRDLNAYLPGDLVTVSSDYFLLSADIALGGVRVAYSAVLQRQGRNEVKVFRRSLRYIPAVIEREGARININSGCMDRRL